MHTVHPTFHSRRICPLLYNEIHNQKVFQIREQFKTLIASFFSSLATSSFALHPSPHNLLQTQGTCPHELSASSPQFHILHGQDWNEKEQEKKRVSVKCSECLNPGWRALVLYNKSKTGFACFETWHRYSGCSGSLSPMLSLTGLKKVKTLVQFAWLLCISPSRVSADYEQIANRLNY